MPDPETPGDPPPIADAGLLFREPAPPSDRTEGPAPAASGAEDAAEGYALGGDPPVDDPPATSVPPIPPTRAARPPDEPRPRERFRLATEEPEVEQTWSRGAEWGPSLARVGLALLFAVAVLWQMFSIETPVLSLALAAILLAIPVVLSYPILITLERPVRITPEQAIKDYFGSLSHHLPHLRRMWLLLSREGRTSHEYASYEGFKAYWDRRLRALKGDAIGRWTPLQFEVAEFKSEKSGGKPRVEARYTVRVLVRGRRADGPIHTAAIRSGLVRGPDGMWYLEDGTLP